MPASREINMRDFMQKTIDKLAEENALLQAKVAELEADLFASELKAKTFEQGYDESQEARRYLEQALAKGKQSC